MIRGHFFNNEALTKLQFDNIDIFPVTVYGDPAMSIKLVDVTASGSVTVDTEPAPDGKLFYPRYHLSVVPISRPCKTIACMAFGSLCLIDVLKEQLQKSAAHHLQYANGAGFF
ncbi:MAG: hypothetical protein Ta2B_17970 [Termitinemataceae bacterium]|nr:MAG: hypothetical protein Ta2B_17970 [Termitinemataceae bacterium]